MNGDISFDDVVGAFSFFAFCLMQFAAWVMLLPDHPIFSALFVVIWACLIKSGMKDNKNDD